MEELSIARNLSEQQAQLPRPDRTSLNAQVAALRQELLEAQESFISETEADAILNQIYGYAAISNVTIDALQTQTMVGEEGEQLPHTAFRLKASGSSIQLLNFVARIEQASKPGVELTNLSLLPGEPADITLLVMEVHFHTIPQVPDPPSPAPATEEPQEPEEPEEPDVAATLTPAPDDPAPAE